MATSKVINNLIGSTTRAKYPAVQGSEWSCNMYYAKNADSEYMESLPGLERLSSIGGKCRGCYVSTIGLLGTHSPEDLFLAMGNALYRLDAYGNRTKLGNLASNGSRISFAETGGPRALLLVCDGAGLYYYDLLNGGDLKAIQLPERISERGGAVTPTHVSVVAGVIAINDSGSGYVYYSKPYPLSQEKRTVYVMDGDQPVYKEDGVTVETTEVDSDRHVFEDDYGAPMYFNGESSSDSVNGLYTVSGLLYVFGPKSCEVWQRGSDTEPWIRLSYTTNSSFGLEAPYSLSSTGGNLYFVASGSQYGKSVMMASGTTFKKISEDWLDAKLLEESTQSAYGFCYSVGEHQFMVLQLNSLGETWVYDAISGWHQRVSRDPSSGMEIQWRVGGVSYFHEKFYAFTNDGLACNFQHDYWYEDYPDGTRLPMIRHRQTAVITSDLRPFSFEELAIEMNVGTDPEYRDDCFALLEVSKDGGNSFGNVRSCKIPRTGNYGGRVRWLGLGLNRLCVIRLTFSAPIDIVLTHASIRAEATGQVI